MALGMTLAFSSKTSRCLYLYHFALVEKKKRCSFATKGEKVEQLARLELRVQIADRSAEQAYSNTPPERVSCGFLWCCTTVSKLDKFGNLYRFVYLQAYFSLT